MPRWVIGNLLTGRRIQTVPALSGSWSDVLNRAGDVQCTVTLDDPVVRRLGLRESAAVGKSFLACIEGDTVLQAGPIWRHSYVDGNRLTLIASGLWSYFERRVLLPAGTTDPADIASDTSVVSSLQGIARKFVEVVLAWDSGGIPVVLPDEIAGSNERNEVGASLPKVGSLLTDLTNIQDGPDIHFQPRLTTDRLGVEWVMRIGSPEQPQLYSAQDVVFNVGVSKSSVSDFRVESSGASLASRGYASGGRQVDKPLIAISDDPTLTDLGYPILETIDSSRSTVTEQSTMDAHAAEITERGRTPVISASFDHDLSQRPFLSAFTVGDFAQVRIKGDPYMADGEIRMRITSRSGDAEGSKVHVELQPEAA